MNLELIVKMRDTTIIFLILECIFMSRLLFPNFWFLVNDIHFSQEKRKFKPNHDYETMKRSSKLALLAILIVYIVITILIIIGI